tara:strand:+ start:362 stop:508 length:147 start_codon:yes stop_codon:yes gene_type:complete
MTLIFVQEAFRRSFPRLFPRAVAVAFRGVQIRVIGRIEIHLMLIFIRR